MFISAFFSYLFALRELARMELKTQAICL